MSDQSELLNDLRHHEREYPSLVHGPLCGRAADAIASLRAQLAIAGEHIAEMTDQLASARKALDLARKRIEYYGAIGPRRHFDHDVTEIFPKIDAVLSLTDDTGNSK